MLDYVPKKEYAPYRLEIENIIRCAQRIMKTKYNTTFQYKLIGSADKHLVTRIKNSNLGYDFDYNLILQKSDLWDNPAKLKQQFMDAFSEAIAKTPYNKLENSTSVITLKVVDRNNSKIIRSCDLAIIYYSEDENEGYRYLKRGKNNSYFFEPRIPSKHAQEKLEEILDNYEQGWNLIRDEYLLLKNRNLDKNKTSHVLYLESIHNVYNHLKQCEKASCRETYINAVTALNLNPTQPSINGRILQGTSLQRRP